MCGIYGAIGSNFSLDEHIINLNKLKHRGPDNQSYFYENNVFLGHTRLSILDTTENANQPFIDDENVLVYNGEIYNFLELKNEFLKGQKFTTNSDTEVLFYLLKKCGERIIAELNGMFAFAFFNKTNHKLLLARDTLGIKPLYYINDRNLLLFSSEIKSLPYKVDLNKVKEFILLKTYQNGYLPFQDIREFPTGHYAIFDALNSKFEVLKYNKIDDIPKKEIFIGYKKNSSNLNFQILDDLINKSIDIHLRSDVKLGALCSGGVDSSLISAIASKINPQIELYHAGVEGHGGEEKYAEIVSKHLKKDIIFFKVSEENYWKVFPYVTYISDLPIYHPNDVSLYYIAQRAHENGVKVLLSGEGADELFGGYTWHQVLIKRKKLFNFYDKHPLLNKILKVLLFKYTKNGLNTMNVYEYCNFMPLGLGFSSINTETLSKAAMFISNDFRNWERWQNHLEIYKDFDKGDRNFGLSIIFNNLYGHLGSILHRTDRILMANSIEGRVPYLENNIIKFALNLPFNYKINKTIGKFILKKVAEKYLPKKVIYRKKEGFPVPWSRYIGKIEKIFENGFIVELTDLSPKYLKLYYENDVFLKFNLISLEVWGRIFVRNEDYQSIVVE